MTYVGTLTSNSLKFSGKAVIQASIMKKDPILQIMGTCSLTAYHASALKIAERSMITGAAHNFISLLEINSPGKVTLKGIFLHTL